MFLAKGIKFIFPFIIILFVPILTKRANRTQLKTDALSKTRCDIQCNDLARSKKADCRIRCRSEESKPGTCPTTDSPQWAAACVQSCDRDSHCDGVLKCCRLGCGTACSEPTDLLTISGLPPIPLMGDVKEKRKSSIVKWSDGVGDSARAVPGRVIYIVQEQHMLGPKYEEPRLGEWTLVLRTNKTKASIQNLVKPGRWYRFRVAAVSAAGSRGFSAPSAAFTPRKGPRHPAPPRRLRVKPVPTVNGTIAARVEWREPRSDLPIMRYKIFWSRRVRGVAGELDSVLVNHQIVPKNQTYYVINDLQPNSLYFIQVQTISQFGVSKLRSEKTAILYNTKESKEQKAPEALRKRRLGIAKSITLENIIWNDHEIKARISWIPSTNSSSSQRYLVRWQCIECNSKPQRAGELTAVTENTKFDIYELKYACKYRVNINKPGSRLKSDHNSEVIVAVPKCVDFQNKIENLTC